MPKRGPDIYAEALKDSPRLLAAYEAAKSDPELLSLNNEAAIARTLMHEATLLMAAAAESKKHLSGDALATVLSISERCSGIICRALEVEEKRASLVPIEAVLRILITYKNSVAIALRTRQVPQRHVDILDQCLAILPFPRDARAWVKFERRSNKLAGYDESNPGAVPGSLSDGTPEQVEAVFGSLGNDDHTRDATQKIGDVGLKWGDPHRPNLNEVNPYLRIHRERAAQAAQAANADANADADDPPTFDVAFKEITRKDMKDLRVSEETLTPEQLGSRASIPASPASFEKIVSNEEAAASLMDGLASGEAPPPSPSPSTSLPTHEVRKSGDAIADDQLGAVLEQLRSESEGKHGDGKNGKVG